MGGNVWDAPPAGNSREDRRRGGRHQILRPSRSRGGLSDISKIRIVLDGLRGEQSIAELCRREGIAESLYYSWSKEFLEAGKKRLAGDTARAATSSEVKDLKRQAQELKEVVAEQALELRLLKKSMIADGGDEA
jgi:transposase